MYPSGKEPRGGSIKKDLVGDWKNLLSITFKVEKTNLLQLVTLHVLTARPPPRRSVTHCSV